MMGLTDNTLNQLRMANLRWKMALLVVLCLSLLVCAGVFGPEYNLTSQCFLTIHVNIEFFCVFVALCTFTVTWYSYLNNCSYYSYFIGLGLLGAGVIDLFHLYTYSGLPTIFAAPCPNRAALFHIIGRIIMGSTFLSSVFLYKKELHISGRLRFFLLTSTIGIIACIIGTVLIKPELYPIMYVDDTGLTPAKVFAQYLVIFLLFLAMVGYIYLYKKNTCTYLELIVLSLTLTIFSEVCFTFNDTIYGLINVLGHLFRFIGYVLIYIAIFLNNVKHPYLQLIIAREELSKANDILEERVLERTRNLENANKQLARAATYDYLTGAVNRMEFSRRFQALTDQKQAAAIHSIIAVDFDSFKKINDTYGHATGDECLKTFVRAAQEVIRPTDTVSRFGGDEFILLLPYTPREGAKVVAEKIRKHLTEVANPSFSFSAGVAEWPKDGQKEKELLARADKALYMAKEKGKNRVE